MEQSTSPPCPRTSTVPAITSTLLTPTSYPPSSARPPKPRRLENTRSLYGAPAPPVANFSTPQTSLRPVSFSSTSTNPLTRPSSQRPIHLSSTSAPGKTSPSANLQK